MRAFWEAIEAHAPFVAKKDLEAKVDAEALAALRSAGILRETTYPGHEEISPSDFMRALRALYRIEGRGLPLPGVFDPTSLTLGWTQDAGTDRTVLLVTMPRNSLRVTTFHPNPALVLVPTARHVGPKLRREHGAGAHVRIEVLEEAITWVGGRLVRAGAIAPEAVVAASQPPPAAAVRIAGAERWNQVRIILVNARTLRIDLPGRSRRVTAQDLGMIHPRTREPTRSWDALHVFCENGGYFQTRRFGGVSATKKVISRLRSDLRAIFGIDGSPFHPYEPKNGWRAKFRTFDDVPDSLEDWRERKELEKRR